MELSTPVKAHQQPLPLLRRPRPPRVAALTSHSSIKRESDNIAPEKLPRTQKTSVYPRNHPESVDKNSRSDFQIHPPYHPPGKKLLGHHVPYSPNEVNTQQVTSHHFSAAPKPTSTHSKEMNNFIPNSAIRSHAMDSIRVCSQPLADRYVEDVASFTLYDFQHSAELSQQRRVCCEMDGKTVSRQNYLKLTGWFAANVPSQEKLNISNLAIDSQPPEEFKPRLQALLGITVILV